MLIIGGRHGSAFKKGPKSITNHEFSEAGKARIPIFALVEQPVSEQYAVYRSNRDNPDVEADKVKYPAVDTPRIFDFMADVQNQSINNALIPFANFNDIEHYLRQQWASMFQSFLVNKNERDRVANILEELTETNRKIEFLSRQVLNAVGSPSDKVMVQAYDIILNEKTSRDLSVWGIRMTPDIFLKNKTLDELCGNQIKQEGTSPDSYTITHGGPPYCASKPYIKDLRDGYKEVRSKLLDLLKTEGVTIAAFLKDSNK